MGNSRVSLCKVDDLSVGEMRQFSANKKEILLARVSEEKFVATAAKCSHYGAPLEKGVLCGDRVVCPWHNACFSVASGEQLEPPGRDNLASYAVQVEDGSVYVDLTDGEDHVVPQMTEQNTERDGRRFVIVGGGAAGMAAAGRLREKGFEGEIVVLSAESELPYDRTKLSKAALQSDEFDGPDLLRSPEFYTQHGIDIKTNATVSKVDVQAQTVTYADGETLEYDALLIATGGKVRSLPIDNSDQPNVFTIRKAQDTQKIVEAAKTAQKVVVIGSGFIGMEAASSLRQKGLEVTVVAPNEVPFEKVLGEQVGKLFQQVHESQGVTFRLGRKATALKGRDRVESVELDNGETLPTDIVIVGIGVSPATAFVDGLATDKEDNSVLVNQYLQAAPGVYAAGDIAQFPHFITGQPTRIEHWRLAMQHGRVAAQNMMQDVALGEETITSDDMLPFKAVPFFWSGQFDMKLRYVGHSENYDDVAIQGSLDDKTFLAFYTENETVMAVAGVGRDRDIAAISELMRLGKMPAASEVKQSDRDWVKALSNA